MPTVFRSKATLTYVIWRTMSVSMSATRATDVPSECGTIVACGGNQHCLRKVLLSSNCLMYPSNARHALENGSHLSRLPSPHNRQRAVSSLAAIQRTAVTATITRPLYAGAVMQSTGVSAPSEANHEYVPICDRRFS